MYTAAQGWVGGGHGHTGLGGWGAWPHRVGWVGGMATQGWVGGGHGLTGLDGGHGHTGLGGWGAWPHRVGWVA